MLPQLGVWGNGPPEAHPRPYVAPARNVFGELCRLPPPNRQRLDPANQEKAGEGLDDGDPACGHERNDTGAAQDLEQEPTEFGLAP